MKRDKELHELTQQYFKTGNDQYLYLSDGVYRGRCDCKKCCQSIRPTVRHYRALQELLDETEEDFLAGRIREVMDDIWQELTPEARALLQ